MFRGSGFLPRERLVPLRNRPRRWVKFPRHGTSRTGPCGRQTPMTMTKTAPMTVNLVLMVNLRHLCSNVNPPISAEKSTSDSLRWPREVTHPPPVTCGCPTNAPMKQVTTGGEVPGAGRDPTAGCRLFGSDQDTFKLYLFVYFLSVQTVPQFTSMAEIRNSEIFPADIVLSSLFIFNYILPRIGCTCKAIPLQVC